MSLKASYEAAAKAKVTISPVKIPGLLNLDENGQLILDENGRPRCDYFVRAMTLGERESFEFAVSVRKGDTFQISHERVRSELLLRTLCEADGARVFKDDEGEELRAIQGADFMPAFLEAQRINGLANAEKNS